MTRPILSLVGLVLLGACAAEAGKSKDLLNGGAGNFATGGAPAMSASGGSSGGIGTGGVVAGGSGGTSMVGSGGAPSTGTGGTTVVGTGGADGMMGTGGVTAGTGGMGTGGAGAGTGGAGGGSTAGTVTVAFTTISYGGEYAPFNYDAVWFEKDGTFIKTAARWAGDAHATDLDNWTTASGGWGVPFFGGGNTADQMDAMSAATLRTHESHTVTWNMMDTEKKLVADGDYEAVVEMTEDRALAQQGKLLRIPFTKGPQPQTVEVPDGDSFKDVVLTYTP